MKIKFYGTRGSIPTPSKSGFMTSEFGGETTCLLVGGGDGSLHILDAGTGIRKLGFDLQEKYKTGFEANLYFTHTHTDHITGFPFFGPLYNPNNKISIYGETKNYKINPDTAGLVYINPESNDISGQQIITKEIKTILGYSLDPQFFPVSIDIFKGIKKFSEIIPGITVLYDNEYMKIETMIVPHPGGCVSYKFTETSSLTNKISSFVFATDFEPATLEEKKKIANFWKGANVVIADGQYEPINANPQNPFKVGFGHSDYMRNLEIGKDAKIKKLFLTHHEPGLEDKYHVDLENRIIPIGEQNGIELKLAREGKEILI